MGIPSSSNAEKSRSRRAKRSAPAAPAQSPLRTIRIRKGLTQIELGRLAGMHRNSIRKLENGTTREVTSEHANALSAVLQTPVEALGLSVRAAVPPRSIRIRRLSPEQRQLIDEVLALAPEDYAVVRETLERLRKQEAKKPRRSRRK